MRGEGSGRRSPSRVPGFCGRGQALRPGGGGTQRLSSWVCSGAWGLQRAEAAVVVGAMVVRTEAVAVVVARVGASAMSATSAERPRALSVSARRPSRPERGRAGTAGRPAAQRDTRAVLPGDRPRAGRPCARTRTLPLRRPRRRLRAPAPPCRTGARPLCRRRDRDRRAGSLELQP